MADIKVHGLAELQKFLDQLPAKLEANVMRGALRAGVNEIRKEAKLLVPVGPPSREGARLYGHYQGALRDSIRVTTRRVGRALLASVKAGGETRRGAQVFYAHMIEFGGTKTKSWYPIRLAVQKAFFIGGKFISGKKGTPKVLMHPPLRAQPFMRPALDRKAGAAIVAAAEYIKRRLQLKHGIDTSGVAIAALEDE